MTIDTHKNVQNWIHNLKNNSETLQVFKKLMIDPPKKKNQSCDKSWRHSKNCRRQKWRTVYAYYRRMYGWYIFRMEIPRRSVYIHWGRLGEIQKVVFRRLSRKEKKHEPKHRDLTHELERWRELVLGENWSHASILLYKNFTAMCSSCIRSPCSLNTSIGKQLIVTFSTGIYIE